MGINGLGMVWVMGRTRVPFPAARIMAFINNFSSIFARDSYGDIA